MVSFILLNGQHFLSGNVFETYDIVRLTAHKANLLAADLEDGLLTEILIVNLTLKVYQLVHFKRQRSVGLHTLAN